MVKADAFYTPVDVAAAVLRLATSTDVDTIADICAGEGALMLAASAKFPGAQLFVADKDACAVARLTAIFGASATSTCDVLSDRSFASTKLSQELRERLALAVINPPFSCRGGATFKAQLPGGMKVPASRAGAVVARAVTLLKPGGEVIGIMPASFESSRKDAALRSALELLGELSFHSRLGRKTFAKCSASSVLIRFRRNRLGALQDQVERGTILQRNGLPVVRGQTPNHRRDDPRCRATLFLHTTGLKGNYVVRTRRRLAEPLRHVSGPVVLFARVGRPNQFQVTAVRLTQPVALSDCVIAVQVGTLDQANEWQRIIRDNWSTIAGYYTGTGAPYITVERLRYALASIGLGSGPTTAENQEESSSNARKLFALA